MSDKGTWPLPELLDEEGFHWLHAERASFASIAQWRSGEWHVIGEDCPITAFEMCRRGWEYLGPVDPRPHSVYLDE